MKNITGDNQMVTFDNTTAPHRKLYTTYLWNCGWFDRQITWLIIHNTVVFCSNKCWLSLIGDLANMPGSSYVKLFVVTLSIVSILLQEFESIMPWKHCIMYLEKFTDSSMADRRLWQLGAHSKQNLNRWKWILVLITGPLPFHSSAVFYGFVFTWFDSRSR